MMPNRTGRWRAAGVGRLATARSGLWVDLRAGVWCGCERDEWLVLFGIFCGGLGPNKAVSKKKKHSRDPRNPSSVMYQNRRVVNTHQCRHCLNIQTSGKRFVDRGPHLTPILHPCALSTPHRLVATLQPLRSSCVDTRHGVHSTFHVLTLGGSPREPSRCMFISVWDLLSRNHCPGPFKFRLCSNEKKGRTKALSTRRRQTLLP